MLKSYKYRLYPSNDQIDQMNHHFGCCRMIWNLALDVKKTAWNNARKNITRNQLAAQLVELKEEYTWLYDVNAQSLQSVLMHLDNAFNAFFKGKGYPKFKKKTGHQSFQCPQRVKIEEGYIILPKIKKVRCEALKSIEGQIKTVTISKTPTGKYFASILIDNKVDIPIKPPITEVTAIGIDVGIKSFVVTSDGRQFEPNRKLKCNLKRMQCLQRRASRKIKNSNNQKKANKCVATLHEKITNQRTDYIHKVTTQLIRDNQTESIVIENLGVAGMLKNRKLSQAISDVSFGRFFEALKYKCNWYGKNLIVIDRFAPSSKRCSCCGTINEALTLADREWICTRCDMRHDRDYNAASNIKWYGLQKTIFNKSSPVGSREEPVELRRLRRAKKQEK